MARRKSPEFPQPELSGVFYAGFLLHVTTRSGEGPLIFDKKRTTVAAIREANKHREAILGMSRHDYLHRIRSELSTTVTTATGELARHRSMPFLAVMTEASADMQTYLTGPVNNEGIDSAMRMGWLNGVPPDNPFEDMSFLLNVWENCRDQALGRRLAHDLPLQGAQ